MNLRKTLFAGSAATFCGLLAGAAYGQAVPNCNDPVMFPNPIYVAGSSAFEPAARNLAIKLQALAGADKVTVIYKATASCDGPAAIRDNVSLTGTANAAKVNATNPDVGDALTCALDAGTKADVGVSDIFYENCPGNAALPDTMKDTLGPVQPMIFIVPESNVTQTNLTAEEAKNIWGCGMTGGVAPFTSETDIQQRNSGSGTQGVVAKAIDVAPGAFKGVMNASGGNLITALMTATMPDKAIGFLAADAYDTRRTTFNALAFRGIGQTKAFYADSTADAFDKKNVRDGHYVVWGPAHFFAAYDKAMGKLTNAKAEKVIGIINGTVTAPGVNAIEIMSRSATIPQCAMKVTRDQDGGFLRPYTPAAPCGCFFESVATKTATPPGCTKCTTDAECGAKKCHNTFCE